MPKKQELNLEQKMLLQQSRDQIMVPQGEIPAIQASTAPNDVTVTLNFLRCGVPAVQLCFQCHHQNWKHNSKWIRPTFEQLALKGERFTFEESPSSEGNQSGYVLVRREKIDE